MKNEHFVMDFIDDVCCRLDFISGCCVFVG